jgi:hypothetical protein
MTTPASHAPGCYYVNLGSGFPTAITGTGTIQRQCNPLLGAALKAAGWHGPFATFGEAKAFIASQSKSPVQNVGGAIEAPLSGIAAVGDFFQRLTQKATWERVGEFAAGAIILYIGLKAIVTPAGQNVGTRTVKHTVSSVAGKAIPAGRAVSTARKIA